MFAIDFFASSWKYCVVMTILRRHDNIASSWHYCAFMTILRRHDNIASSWQYCVVMSILRRHDIIASSWQYCVVMTILRRHDNIASQNPFILGEKKGMGTRNWRYSHKARHLTAIYHFCSISVRFLSSFIFVS